MYTLPRGRGTWGGGAEELQSVAEREGGGGGGEIDVRLENERETETKTHREGDRQTPRQREQLELENRYFVTSDCTEFSFSKATAVKQFLLKASETQTDGIRQTETH